jgi:hypothetical protein
VSFLELIIQDFVELKPLSNFEKKYLKLLISDAILTSREDEEIFQEAQKYIQNHDLTQK